MGCGWGAACRRTLCVAGVALGDMDCHFAWQAWHLRDWVTRWVAAGVRLVATHTHRERHRDTATQRHTHTSPLVVPEAQSIRPGGRNQTIAPRSLFIAPLGCYGRVILMAAADWRFAGHCIGFLLLHSLWLRCTTWTFSTRARLHIQAQWSFSQLGDILLAWGDKLICWFAALLAYNDWRVDHQPGPKSGRFGFVARSTCIALVFLSVSMPPSSQSGGEGCLLGPWQQTSQHQTHNIVRHVCGERTW